MSCSNWPVFVQKWSKWCNFWPKFGHLARWQAGKKIFVINFFVQKSKTKILRKKSTFYPSNPPYDHPLPTLTKILKCLKRRFFTFFSRKKLKIIFYYHCSWNMVSRVEVGVFALLTFSKCSKSCHFCPKMTQNQSLSDVSPNYVLPFPNFCI